MAAEEQTGAIAGSEVIVSAQPPPIAHPEVVPPPEPQPAAQPDPVETLPESQACDETEIILSSTEYRELFTYEEEFLVLQQRENKKKSKRSSYTNSTKIDRNVAAKT